MNGRNKKILEGREGEERKLVGLKVQKGRERRMEGKG